jgi:hypothetical protein
MYMKIVVQNPYDREDWVPVGMDIPEECVPLLPMLLPDLTQGIRQDMDLVFLTRAMGHQSEKLLNEMFKEIRQERADYLLSAHEQLAAKTGFAPVTRAVDQSEHEADFSCVVNEINVLGRAGASTPARAAHARLFRPVLNQLRDRAPVVDADMDHTMRNAM